MTDSLRPGFAPSSRTTGLISVIGPCYVRQEERQVTNALVADERHLNSRGFVHGAVIACLLDITLSDNIVAALPQPAGGVTATLTVHYIDKAVAGDWLEASATAVQQGRRLAHAQGTVIANGLTVATGTAAFTISPPHTNGVT